MGWFGRRKRKTARDGELSALHEETDARLSVAKAVRDSERRKLQEESRTLVQPLRRVREGNHFAELALNAFRRRG